MSNENYVPKIYVYKLTDPRFENFLKVGYTTADVEVRVTDQFGSRGLIAPLPYEILHSEVAIDNKGEEFWDTSVHLELEDLGVERVLNVNNRASEYFVTDVNTVIKAIANVKQRKVRKPKDIFISEEYLNIPLTAKDKDRLATELNITDDRNRLVKWTTIKGALENKGYTIKESMPTIDGKRTRVSTIKAPEIS